MSLNFFFACQEDIISKKPIRELHIIEREMFLVLGLIHYHSFGRNYRACWCAANSKWFSTWRGTDTLKQSSHKVPCCGMIAASFPVKDRVKEARFLYLFCLGLGRGVTYVFTSFIIKEMWPFLCSFLASYVSTFIWSNIFNYRSHHFLLHCLSVFVELILIFKSRANLGS